MSRLRVGIVGAGLISELHAKGYQQSESAKIVAVCDINEDRAIKSALDWGANRYYTDFNEFLADPNVDAVDIITPHYLHGGQVLSALKADKHVLVERPLTVSYKEVGEIISAVQGTDRIFQVFEPLLFYKPLNDARSLMDAGEIGQTIGLQITATVGKSTFHTWDFEEMFDEDLWRFDPSMAGGTPMLYDLVYPAFCAALFLVGPIDKVAAWDTTTTITNGLRIDAPSSCMWRHATDFSCFGQLSLHYAPDRYMHTPYHPVELRITVHGTRGSVELVRSSDPTHLESSVVVRRDSREVYYGQKDDAFLDSFLRGTENYISSCLGETEPMLGVFEAQQLTVLCLAYAEACRQGRFITLQVE